MNWAAFERAAPALAAVGREAFDRTGLVFLGTVRRDGWPRIWPVEHVFLEGDLLLGMMWQSLKALDLLRDPRCVVHASVSNPDGRTDPEFKLYGQVRDVADARLREAYGDAWWARSQWRPSEPYHLFALDIESSGYVRYDEGDLQHIETWPRGRRADRPPFLAPLPHLDRATHNIEVHGRLGDYLPINLDHWDFEEPAAFEDGIRVDIDLAEGERGADGEPL